MRNLSTEFKEEQNNGNHRYLKFVDITLKNGTELHLDNSNLWSNGFTFEEAVSSGDNFDIGAAIINKFSIVINNIEEKFSEYVFSGAKAVVYVGLKLSTGIEKIRICTGTVSEEPRQKSSIITLTFLDNMSKFDRDYADVKTVFPATRNQVVRDICSICGVTLQTVKFDRDDFVIQSRPENEALTCRQMLAWVAQIGCQWAKCDEYGRLCIGWYENLSLETNNIINIKSITNMSIDLDDIVITGVKVTEHKENPSEDNPAKTYMYGKEGYVLSIAGNKLITENTGNTIASIIGEKCVGMKFRQFSLNCITDISIEAGDTVKVTDRKGNTFLSYATNVNLQPGNYESISCGAESPERNSAKQYSLLTQVEVAARKNIQKEKTEREKALEELAGRLENSSGVFTTVETDTGGGKIYYLHNKPKLSESNMVWKMTAEAWAVSTDGGKTWNAGMTVDGDTIVRILTAMGINADWINTGAITVRDSNQNIIFSVDMDTKRVIISGDSVQIGGRPVQDVINNGISESKNYSDKKLSDYANTISKDLENLQTQVDGQVEDWYFDYEPSMQNIPASQWTTTEERQKHIGDRFFWKSKGYAYRFMEDNGVWGWILLQDTDITKAMQTAQNAKDVADGKRRTFVSTPKPPYDIGDLWTNGEDILTCTVARASGSLYVSTDWKKLNEYTDDTVANQALEEAKKAHNILIQLDNEYQGIPVDYKGNISTFPEVKTQVYVFFGHQDVSAQCTYTIQKSASVSGTWDNTRRVYTVTGLSADTGWVDITASYLGVLYATKRFVVSKIKGGIPGPTGPQGNPGPVSRNYMLESSDAAIKKGADNRLSPATITFKAFYRDGNAASRTAYAGRFKIEESTNGTSFASKYTSTANESTKSYTPSSAEVRIIRCTLYAAGGTTNSLDTQTVVVLTDVSNLEVGSDNLVNKDDVQGLYETVVKRTGYTYDISVTSHKEDGSYRGVFIPETIFKVGESYVFSYKFTVKSGSVTKIGGHQAAFTTIKAVIDGTEYKTGYDAGYPLDSKKTEHTVAVYLKYHGVGEDKKLYIQPNRQGGTNGAWNILLTEVQVRKGNAKTDWQPSLKDSLDSIQFGGRNMILNSTFNRQDYKWVGTDRSAMSYPKEGRDGSYCAKITGKFNTSYNLTPDVTYKVKPGETYTLSGWTKSKDIVKGTTNYFVSLYLGFYDKDHKWKAEAAINNGQMPLSSDWERNVLTCTVPDVSGIDHMWVYLYARDFTGTIWWDDMQLEKSNKVSDWSPAVEDSESLIITLSNEAHSITTDKNGNGGNFSDCETTVQVYNGTQDVTAQTTYTVTKSSGITGAWDGANHKYKVTALSTDNGYVDIKAVYNGISVIKRFTVSKSKTGATGATGADGKTSYFHIKYAPVPNPTASQMTETPNVYIGTYVDFVQTDSTDPKKYTWYRFQGLQGPEGNQGIPGKNGANGQTSYLHIKYSNDGGKTFTANTGETPGDYIGQYVDFVQADSTDPKKYNWSKTKGETGRTYFIELSANILKRGQNNKVLPATITAKAFYRDGSSAARTAYAGRWKIETSTNGVDYTTAVSSTGNESSKSYSVGGLAANVVSVRFTLYAAGGLTTQLDMQSIPVVIDVDNLTHEQIFNLLTNNGTMKGIYQSGGQLYINGTYIRSLIITGDMIQGKSVTADKLDVKELSSVGATVGGFKINQESIYAQNYGSSIKNLELRSSRGILNKQSFLMFRGASGNMSFREDGIVGDNGTVLRLYPVADTGSGIGDGSHHNMGSTKFSGTVTVSGALKVSGTKSVTRKTKHYGEQDFYCYEMPTPILGDIGSGKIGEDGKCYIDNCDILQEAANTEVAYFVFLQKCGKGDLWVSQKTPTYFVVEGTPGLSFAWEVKIKQTGYEYLRYNNDACDTNVGFRETDYLSQMEQEIEALYEDMEEITL